MCRGDAPEIAPHRRYRRSEVLGQSRHRALPATLPDTVADVDQGPFSLVKPAGKRFQVIVRGVPSLDVPGRAVDKPCSYFLTTQHAIVNGQVYRPHRRRGSNHDRSFYGRRQSFRLYDRPARFREGRRD